MRSSTPHRNPELRAPPSRSAIADSHKRPRNRSRACLRTLRSLPSPAGGKCLNQRNPGRRAMRIAWAVLLVVFTAYVAVALGVGGSGVLDFFSSWVCIGLVLGAAALLAVRGFASDDRRAPWLCLSLGAGMWAIGELIYEIAYSEAPELAPYPSIADAFWLGSYFAVRARIVLVLRSRPPRAFHATMWLPPRPRRPRGA